jgi:serine/threonine-protein kinase
MSPQDRLDPMVAAALADKYRILDVLEPSGLGNVFRAEDLTAGGREVALKILHRPLSEDADFAARLLDRGAAARRVRHPNVTETHACDRASDGTLYVAMELVEGPTLAQRLAEAGSLPLAEAVDIASQCAAALDAVHAEGLVYRNLKPHNIVLARRPDGSLLVKIRDFSIAKVREAVEHTAVGAVLGTPTYMSYEQASGWASEKLDGRSDIYALGLVVYEMLAGRPPYSGETPVACIMQHLTAAPPSIREARPELAEAVEAVILRALAKDRDRRHHTAPAFAAALRAAAGIADPAPAVPSEPEAAPEPMPAFPPPWRRRVPAAPARATAGAAGK